jgi:ferredoxin--NADP+ reductase
MNEILSARKLAPNIFEMVVAAPRVAAKARPGQFIIVMGDAQSERIPLTIADSDADAGTLTIVLMAIGASTQKLAQLQAGDALFALLGPLGQPSEIDDYGTVVMVAGGVGAAPIYPIAKALHERGNRVITIHGARNSELLFWTDRMAAVSDEYIVCTDDGSQGRKGLVTDALKDVLAADQDPAVGAVYAIGPTIMMKFCAEATRGSGIHTIVSLNTIMIDGTGMCGGCRVEIGEETKFTCVDGPEFDGHAVNWDNLLTRQKLYHEQEQCALERYVAGHSSVATD